MVTPPSDQPDQLLGSYSIQRFDVEKGTQPGGDPEFEMAGLDHITTVGILQIVLGDCPTTLRRGGEVGEEWKVHLGGPHWIVAKRVS